MGRAAVAILTGGNAVRNELTGQHLGFERLQRGGQRHATIPDSLLPDQPKRWILRERLSIIDILIARQVAVHGLAEQISQWKLSVLAAPRIAKMLRDEIAQSQSFIQLTYQNEVAIRGDP